LAAVAGAGLVLTASFIGILILSGRSGQQTSSMPGFIALSFLWVLGLIVTAGALVWATVLALRMKRWGWASALVIGTLALLFITLFTLPGALIVVFALRGPSAATAGPRDDHATAHAGAPPPRRRSVSAPRPPMSMASGAPSAQKGLRMRRAARVCSFIVLGGVGAMLLLAALSPLLYPVIRSMNGGDCSGGLGDACNFELAFLGFLLLFVPVVVALLTTWILGLVLVIRLREWDWLVSLAEPIVLAAFLLGAGALLTANETYYQLAIPLLLIGGALVALTFLVSLAYSLWPHPQASSLAPSADDASPIPLRTGTRPGSRLQRSLVVAGLITGVTVLAIGGAALSSNVQQFRPEATLPPQLANALLYVDDGSTVSAVRASDGRQLWHVPDGSPTIAAADGVVYIAIRGGSTRNDCCTINATLGSDGTSLWQSSVIDESVSVLGASAGLVYVGQLADVVTALQAADGQARWQYATGRRNLPNVATADSMMFISGAGPESLGAVYALRPTDGELIWKWVAPPGSSYIYQPVVAQGLVYVGANDGHVYALREQDGTPLWQYDTGTSDTFDRFRPAVSSDIVYVEVNDSVAALGASDGMVMWRHSLGGENSTSSVRSLSPAVADGVVYASTTDGNLYALQAATGKELWRYHVGDWLFETAPVAVGGAVFYGIQPICSSLYYCNKGYLYALRASDGAPAWRLETATGAPLYVIDPAT
jgi:outer membrane protein assembly factor BamB